MPIRPLVTEAREWTEEFVAELYEVNRYLVFRNLPTETGAAGGRADADVVGFRRRADTLEICDVEVGTYYDSARAIAADIAARFNDARKDHVLKAIRTAVDPGGVLGSRYTPVFVDASWSDRQFPGLKSMLRARGILGQSLEQLIDRAPVDIRRWQRQSATPKGTEPQLPRSFKILRILEAAHWTWKWERGWDADLPEPAEPPFA
jgi:hypothetical protein